MMYASRAEHDLPKGYTAQDCSALHARRPFPQTPEEIAESRVGEVRDKNFRIEIAEDGIHIYQPRRPSHRAGRLRTVSPSSTPTRTDAHAFYLGAELARAEIAWRLAKRYAQDEPLDWGVAADAPADDRTRLKKPVTR